jgi:propionyl-CoA synthetase
MSSAQSRYHEVYAGWKADPEGFWAQAAREIDWIKPADKVFDAALGAYGTWFTGAVCNTCYNAVDRHAATRGDQAAIIYDSPVTNSKRRISYAELRDEVATLAAVLQDMGVRKGDRVVIYMPMIPEAAFAMLACARIGAIHSVVFGGFAAKGDPLGLLRHRGRPYDPLQAAPRRGDHAFDLEARCLPRLPAAAMRGFPRRGPRH